MSSVFHKCLKSLKIGVALSLVAIGFSVAPPAYARSPLCDTTPTLGQFVVCTYSDGASFQFEVPQSFGVWRATQAIIKLSGAGGGAGGGNHDFEGGDGGNGALIGARINLPGDARSVSVNLGAGGLGGSGVSSGRGNNGASGGTSTLSLNGLVNTQLILEAAPGQGGSGANSESGEAGLNRLGERDNCLPEDFGDNCERQDNPWPVASRGGPEHSGENGRDGFVEITFMYGYSDGTDCSNSQLDEVFVGSGSAGDPFLIESESDLQRISGCTFAGKYLKQTVDITTSDPAPVKDGAFNLPNGLSVGLPGPYKFRGTYDGNGKSITFDLRNTSCSLGIQYVGCGVFRQTEAAEIKNLTIDASNAGGPGIAGITPNSGGWLVATDYMRPDDSSYRGIARPYNFSLFSGIKVFGNLLTGAGGVVGSAQGTHIYNSSMTGKFVGNSAGGIVGPWASNVTIRRSSSSVDPNGTLLGGGIVGPHSEGVSVTDVYSTGDVTLGGGGIVGPYSIDAEVQNCYVTGNIPSTEDGFDHAAGGVIGADATVSDPDHRITVRNCYTTGSIGTGAGGIIGNLVPDSEVSVFHSFTSGVSSNYPMGVIFADNTSINDTGGAYFGEGNYSNGNTSPSPGFQLSKFVDFVSTEYGAWNNGSFTNATWALCASVHPTLPYLTAHYASDPCAVITPPSSPTTVAPVLQQTPVTTVAPNKNFPPTAKPININIGQVTMTIGDAITPISRTPETIGSGFRLSGGGIEVQTNPPPQGFTSGGTSLLTLSGFSPSSQIGVFLFSSPISVGSLLVKSDGIARGTITLPTSVPPGSHTLQFTGWTKSNEPIVLSAGINVQPQVRSLQKSVNFSTGIAHMSSAGRHSLLRLIGESGALVGPAQTVITYSTSGNKSQVRLAQLRANVIEKFLKLNDMPGTIRIRGINSYQLQDPRILIIRTNS